MTKWGRIKMILSSLLMIFSAFLLIISQEDAFDVIAALLSIYLIAYAIREFHYFFTLARFMVGGKYLFYRAILALDFGIFAVTMTRMPSEIILFFLCASFIFTGVIDILKSMDSKKMGGSWRLRFAKGALTILFSALCMVFLRTPDTAISLLVFNLLYNAVIRIITALKPANIMAIQ